MAQPIISPDGSLQITRHRGTFPIMGNTQVQGSVENTGAESANAEIRIDFYDAADEFVSSLEEVLTDIKPGETRSFDTVCKFTTSMTEIDSYKIFVAKKS
jgi:hypothetical protein